MYQNFHYYVSFISNRQYILSLSKLTITLRCQRVREQPNYFWGFRHDQCRLCTFDCPWSWTSRCWPVRSVLSWAPQSEPPSWPSPSHSPCPLWISPSRASLPVHCTRAVSAHAPYLPTLLYSTTTTTIRATSLCSEHY